MKKKEPKIIPEDEIEKENLLDICNAWEFKRIIFKEAGIKYVITSGGLNPYRRNVLSTFETAKKDWKKIRNKEIKDEEKIHIEKVEADHDRIVESENNPLLPNLND